MTARPIRLIDLGAVSGPRSQAVYHGLAEARTEATPDTVVLCVPHDAHVCIGYHQALDRTVDLAFCEAHGLPVIRRELGGGAVSLDRDQLFVQWVMAPDSLPPRIDMRFEMFTRPIVATYRQLGVEAEFQPVNDIHVDGRKICGTGAARIGEAEVLVGNFLFDFDVERMVGILAVDSEEQREHVRRGLKQYMTTLRRELGRPVPPAVRDEVKRLYRNGCAAELDAELVDGALSPGEIHAIELVEQRFADPAYRQGPAGPGLERTGVKIHEDVWIRESRRRSQDGRLRAVARVKSGRIDDITLIGEHSSDELAAALRGCALRRETIAQSVGHVLSPGVHADAWVETILDLKDDQSERQEVQRVGRL